MNKNKNMFFKLINIKKQILILRKSKINPDSYRDVNQNVLNHYESACSKSAITSFTVSKPTETRTKPSEIPTASFSSVDNLLCVVEAGCVTIVLASPIFAESEHNLILSKNALPASIPPLI